MTYISELNISPIKSDAKTHFDSCNIDVYKNQTPMVKALATREEMSTDGTKHISIILPNGMIIYEWFKGTVSGNYVYEFVQLQEEDLCRSQDFELKIVDKNNAPGNVLKKDLRISDQCNNSRLYLYFCYIEKDEPKLK